MTHYLIQTDGNKRAYYEIKTILDYIKIYAKLKYKLKKKSSVYLFLKIKKSKKNILDLLLIRSYHLIYIGKIIKKKPKENFLKLNREFSTVNLDKVKKSYIKNNEFEFLIPYFKTKIFENFIINNQFIFNGKRNRYYRRTKIEIYSYKKKISNDHRNKIIEKYKHYLNYKVDLEKASDIYRIFIEGKCEIITKEYRRGNRKYFCLFDCKNLAFVGRASLPIAHSIFSLNILMVEPYSIIYDICCGSGSILFTASLFNIFSFGSDILFNSMVGKNISNRTKTELLNFSILSNFKMIGTEKIFLGSFLGNINKMKFKNIIIDYIITDLPYGVRCAKKGCDFLPILNQLKNNFKCKGIVFWIEKIDKVKIDNYNLIYREDEILKTLERSLFIYKK